MATDSGIDPRYAAQFQRGFDPAQHTVEPVRERRGPLPIQNMQTPVVQRVPDPPRLVERPAVDRVAPPPAQVVDEPGADDDFAEPLVRRWKWVMPAFGAALLAVAALLLGSAMTDTGMYTGYMNQADYVWSSIRTSLPGPLLVASVLTFTVWLVARGVSSGDAR